MALSTAESNVAKFAGALKQENNPGLVNAEQKALAKKTAENVARDHEKRFGATGALDIMAESPKPEKIKSSIESKIEDPAKRTAADDEAKLAKSIGELNYDTLGVLEKGAVRGEVDKVITKVAAINTLLGMGGISKTDFIEAMVKDDLFGKKVRDRLNAQLDAAVDKGDLSELKKALSDITEEVNLSKYMKDKMPGRDLSIETPAVKNTELTAARNRINSERRDAPYNPTIAARVEKIDRFRDYRNKRLEIDYQLEKISNERTAGPLTPARAAALTAQETALNGQKTSIDGAITAYTPAPGVEQNFLRDLDTIDRTTNADNVTAKEPNRLKAAHDVAVGESKANTAEDNYVNGLKAVLEGATEDYLRDKMDAAEKNLEKTEDEKKSEADAEAKKKEEAKKAAQAKAMSKIRTTLRNPKGQVNKAQAEAYFNKLIGGDPRSALEPMLMGMPVAERTAVLSDEAFCQNAAMMMLRAHLEKGKVTKDHINALADTDWGEKIIDGALAKEAKAAEQLGKLDGRLYKTMMERLKGWSGEHKKGIIMALLAAIATGMIYPAVAGVLAAEGLTIASVTGMAGAAADKAAAFAISGVGTAAAVGGAAVGAYKASEG